MAQEPVLIINDETYSTLNLVCCMFTPLFSKPTTTLDRALNAARDENNIMPIKLSRLLNYKNISLISRYQKDYPHSKMSAYEALQELMKFIWLCNKHMAERARHPKKQSLNFICVIHSEMIDIDNMWHTFLLFTRDYHNFCRDYLDGNFFHHDPIVRNQRATEKKYVAELERYLSYIYKNLGTSTLKKWFEVC